MPNCLFCKIINKEIPANIEYEDDNYMVIHDINPKAKHHLLILPKKHISMVSEITEKNKNIIADSVLLANQTAKKLNSKGYKLLYNVGADGGQEIFHIHLHLMGY
ncbi:histidine triad nucleotide-binding protein [Candidatus Peregrinibacteria bacterium RIFOXYC2_FULL_33_13]|nr:MAG: Histidine triad (HIT) protein [Candidatus Peregrinibacteria bacterium GW2011_GWA2_33_10]KKP39171.1 MAG: histidine triad (HIT) protein, Hit-like protein involved in cell-cycle regulation [Candidatus Peregrinibacteria bacterium GW2011_GWC2_33_13]OGJ55314.1 MAG: histidine triad nucleotide-binding protein [Candidatus Peregrinibacteria bacterium RIFOXYC2_FULL_33_13]